MHLPEDEHLDEDGGNLRNHNEMTIDLRRFCEGKPVDLSLDHLKHWATGYRPSKNMSGLPVLHEAAHRGDTDIVKVALRLGDPSEPDSSGATPLQRAAAAGSLSRSAKER